MIFNQAELSTGWLDLAELCAGWLLITMQAKLSTFNLAELCIGWLLIITYSWTLYLKIFNLGYLAEHSI